MDEFLRLLDEARADERGAARSRERHLRQAAEEGARLIGALVDLAETGVPVSVRCTTGRSHHGPIRLVGADFCVVGEAWVAVAGITTVRVDPGGRPAPVSGERSPTDLLLIEALARIAAERPRLTFVLTGGDVVAGELRSVGQDVVTLRLDGEPNAVYVSASTMRAVLRSG